MRRKRSGATHRKVTSVTHPDRYPDPGTPVPPSKFARGFFAGFALALVFWLLLALAIVAFS